MRGLNPFLGHANSSAATSPQGFGAVPLAAASGPQAGAYRTSMIEAVRSCGRYLAAQLPCGIIQRRRRESASAHTSLQPARGRRLCGSSSVTATPDVPSDGRRNSARQIAHKPHHRPDQPRSAVSTTAATVSSSYPLSIRRSRRAPDGRSAASSRRNADSRHASTSQGSSGSRPGRDMLRAERRAGRFPCDHVPRRGESTPGSTTGVSHVP